MSDDELEDDWQYQPGNDPLRVDDTTVGKVARDVITDIARAVAEQRGHPAAVGLFIYSGERPEHVEFMVTETSAEALRVVLERLLVGLDKPGCWKQVVDSDDDDPERTH